MKALFALLFLLPLPAFGQTASITWTKSVIDIGDRSTLKIVIKDAPKKINYQPLSGEIACRMRVDSSSFTIAASAEIIGTFHDTSFTVSGKRTWEGTYEITAWDTGAYVMPAIIIPLSDTTFTLQAPDLKVQFIKKTVSDGLQEMTVDVGEDNWWWARKYWWLLFIPAGIIIILLIRRRNEVRTVKQISLKHRSLAALNALKKAAYWKNDRLEEHYIEFSFLLRSFLSARYELNLMERTTYEAMQLLGKQNIQQETLQRIKALLELSDMVKFARDIPEEEETERGLLRMEELITELSPLELINE